MRIVLTLSSLLLLAAGEPAESPPVRSGTEKVEVNLVLIDVVVRDRKENPIRGLTRGDFELVVDAKPADPAAIEVFEEVCVEAAGEAGATPPQEPSPKPATGEAPRAAPAAGAASPHIVVYLDFSQLSMAAHRKSILAARDYFAADMQPSDRTMILAYMNGLRLVQDFTSDKSLLVSHLDTMLDNNAVIDTDAFEEGSNIVAVAESLPRKSLAIANALQEEARTRRSLRALTSVMPRLAGIRGRKALVLFSDILREEPGVEYLGMIGSTPKGEGIDVYPEIIRLTREANAAGVSLYTVHAAGLDEHPAKQAVSGYATSELRGSEGATSFEQLQVGGAVSSGAATAVSSALGLQSTLAVGTGGRALQRTNDTAGVLRSARQDLSCYYLLGYAHAGTGDDSQHEVVLRLKESDDRPSGLTVRYRPSFTDRSESSRRDLMMRSAMEVPELYAALPVTLEAYALAPRDASRAVLIKTMVPMSELSLIPEGETQEGRVEIRGTVMRELEAACVFRQDIAIRRRSEQWLVYQTGCVLPAGEYSLTVVVLDRAGTLVGADRAPLHVASIGTSEVAQLGDVHLWTKDPDALVVTTGAADIGLANRAGAGDFLLRAERRLPADAPGVLSFLYCPAPGEAEADRPTLIHMKVLGGDQVVTDDEVRVAGPSELKGSGCHEIRRNLAPRSLPAGFYTFEIATRGTGSPLNRRADFAIE